MRTILTAVVAIAASLALFCFGGAVSHPVPHLALKSLPTCATLSASSPHPQARCELRAENNTTSSSHRGDHP